VAFGAPVNGFVTPAITAFSILHVRRREMLASLIGNYEFGYSRKHLKEMKMRKDG
jgi:hypothetical protein